MERIMKGVVVYTDEDSTSSPKRRSAGITPGSLERGSSGRRAKSLGETRSDFMRGALEKASA